MDQLYIYETRIIDIVEPTFDKEPFYAIVFLFAVLILSIAFTRSKNKEEGNIVNGHITDYNVLSLPVTPLLNDRYPKEGILFNSGSKNSFLKSFLYSFLAIVIFGFLIFFLNNFNRSPHCCFF